MRSFLCSLLLSCAALPAAAQTRIEFAAARVEGPGWQARDLRAQWIARGAFDARIGALRGAHPQLPELAGRLACRRLDNGDGDKPGIRCEGGQLHLDSAPVRADAGFDLYLRTPTHWTLVADDLQVRLQYGSEDGRIATEGLQIRGRAQAALDGDAWQARTTLRANSGQAYVEPVFMDLAEHPLHLNARLRGHTHGDAPVQVDALDWQQDGLGHLQAQGQFSPAAVAQRHRFDIQLQQGQLATLSTLVLAPFMAGTRLDDLTAGGEADLQLHIENAAPRRAEVQLRHATFDSAKLGLRLDGISGTAHWRAEGTAPDSRLQWRGGAVGAVPLGATVLRFEARPRGLRLLEPLRLPVLDGALNIYELSLDAIGSDNPSADFDADLEPIDLALLGRSLDWPQFGGSLSGRLPGLHLRDRELSLDGALHARVFDGDITIDGLRVLDPFGVLPRVRAELRLRRLDLEAITRAFSFGRITGRLDGDVRSLRLLGWRPVAMDARLYTTPGDRSRQRISQRAIDNISAVGGGPGGVLQRGVLSVFEDFAYARIGWRCILDNNVCRMSGVEKVKGDPDRYVLVEGRLLPRIDVIGHAQAVDWNRFVNQLLSVRGAGAAEVR